jgi:hypothetical protein
VSVNTTVDGLGRLQSYLMLCPGQELGDGSTSGAEVTAGAVTEVSSGETYCLQHVVPNLPLNVDLTNQQLYSNETEVPTVSGAYLSASITTTAPDAA